MEQYVARTAEGPEWTLRVRVVPVEGGIPESLQWLPAEFCEVTTDLPENECSLEQLLARGSGDSIL